MLKRTLLLLMLAAFLATAAAAATPGPGVFLPFYFLYDDAVTVTPDGIHPPGPVDGHQAVFFENHPMNSEVATITGSRLMLNIMRARYFSRFNVATGGTYKLGVAKGTDDYGMDPDPNGYKVSGKGFDKIEVDLKYGQGGGLLPPDGTVPADIQASGGDVVLTWDKVGYPLVDIYRLTGDGTGQYDKTYPGTSKGSVKGWELVKASDASGQYKDLGIIAADPKEAYYKVLVGGQPPATKIPLAWATGKFDLNMAQGYNLASTPLVPLHGNGIDEVLVDNAGGALRHYIDDTHYNQVYFFDEVSGLTIKAGYNGSAWVYSPSTPFSISLGNGYWVYENRTSKRLSTVGAVIVTDNNRALGSGFSLISSPLPTRFALLNDGNLPAVGTDEIYLFQNNLMEKMINGGAGTWLHVMPGYTPFGLYPGVGYWYKNNASTYTWKLTP